MGASGGAVPGADLPLLTLIIPVFNEARRLPASLAACVEFLERGGVDAEVIVADDGSTDGTVDAYGRAAGTLGSPRVRLRYLRLPHRGKGGAVRAGVAAANGDPVMFFDADLSIPLTLVEPFRAALAAGADIAVASRYAPGSTSRRPWWRKLMGRMFRICVHAIVPVDVRDTQCGGKAYRAPVAKDVFARSRLDSFSFDAEVLHIARLRHLRVREIPFHLDQDHITRIDFVRDAPKMLRDLLVIRRNSALGRYR